MDHAWTLSLARFCADQYFGFEPDAWTQFASSADRVTLAAAAGYLSMTSWYGREEELARIAAALVQVAEADTRAPDGAQQRRFDLEHFSAALRIEIATRRLSGSKPDCLGVPSHRRPSDTA